MTARIHLNVGLTLRLHTVLQAIQRYGGRIESRLISEEDLRLTIFLGPFAETVEIVAHDGSVCVAGPGETVSWYWDWAVGGEDGITPARYARWHAPDSA